MLVAFQHGSLIAVLRILKRYSAYALMIVGVCRSMMRAHSSQKGRAFSLRLARLDQTGWDRWLVVITWSMGHDVQGKAMAESGGSGGVVGHLKAIDALLCLRRPGGRRGKFGRWIVYGIGRCI